MQMKVREIGSFGIHCDEIYEYVLILVVKGNLPHRIEKLGTEKTDAEL